MRVYDYHCTECGLTEEKFVASSEVEEVPCLLCGGKALKQVCAPRFALDPNDKAGFPTAYAKWDKHHKDYMKTHPTTDEAG